MALLAAVLVAGCGTGRAPTAGAPRPTATTGTAAAEGRTAVRPLARSVPVRLEIPAIGVDTPVSQLGLAADGTVQVPPIEAHAPAGWYRLGAAPGQVGPAVILAHVTVGRFGDGVFVHLKRLRPGDRAVVRLRDGAVAVFAVTAVRTVAKADFPTHAVYGAVDRPELRLITCGGPRDPSGTGYLDNVVVYAALTSARPGE